MTMANVGRAAAILCFVAGCGGADECEVPVTVTVTAMNAPFTTASVVLTENAGAADEVEYLCPSNSDGTYTCSVPEGGTFILYVDSQATQVPFFEIYAATLEVPQPEDCEAAPFAHAAALQPESGGV